MLDLAIIKQATGIDLSELALRIEQTGFICSHCKDNRYIGEGWQETPCPHCNKQVFNCNTCKDKGYTKFDKVITPCVCNNIVEKKKAEAIKSLQTQSMQSKRAEAQTFENFTRYPGTEQAYRVLMNFAVNPYERWIYLWSATPGNGKSHLAAATMNMLKRRGMRVIMQTWPELMKRIKASFNNPDESSDQLMNTINGVDVLIIDDLMAGNTSKWDMGELFDTINYRYNNHLPTLIVSNVHPANIPEFRVKSRLQDTKLVTVVENKGTDRRTQQ